MNISQLTNISPDKFYEMLDMSGFYLEKDIDKVSDNIKNGLLQLDIYGIDSTKYSLILQSMDKYQWKNFYIYLYSRWQKCSEKMLLKHNFEMEKFPVYHKSFDIENILNNILNKDIAYIIFFINSLQIFFIPNPN